MLFLQDTERKSRKSVAFTDEQLVVDADGSVTMVNATEEPPKDSAQSHTPRTTPLHNALEAFTNPDTQPEAPADAEPTPDAAPAEDGGLDLSLMKKKKKKKVKIDDGEEGDAAAEGAAEDGGLDLSMKKKKKKKTKDAAADEDDEFTAKLKKLEVKDDEAAEARYGGAMSEQSEEGRGAFGLVLWGFPGRGALYFCAVGGRSRGTGLTCSRQRKNRAEHRRRQPYLIISHDCGVEPNVYVLILEFPLAFSLAFSGGSSKGAGIFDDRWAAFFPAVAGCVASLRRAVLC